MNDDMSYMRKTDVYVSDEEGGESDRIRKKDT